MLENALRIALIILRSRVRAPPAPPSPLVRLIFRVTYEWAKISHDITMTRVEPPHQPCRRRLTGGMEATQLHHSGVDVLSKLMSANFVGEVRNASSGEPTQAGRSSSASPTSRARVGRGGPTSAPPRAPWQTRSALEGLDDPEVGEVPFRSNVGWVSGRSAPHGLTPLNRCRRFASTVHDRCDDTPWSRRGQVATCARDSCNTRGPASASSGCGDAHQPAQGLPERVDDGVNVPIRAELVLSTVVLGDRLRLSMEGRGPGRWVGRSGRRG